MTDRQNTTCEICDVTDTQPRHHHVIQRNGALYAVSLCFPCATEQGVHDYSEIISGAEAAGVSILDHMLSLQG